MNIDKGIYKIKNLVNNKCYIGQSVNLKKRKIKHFLDLKNNKHNNNHLQNAYNKYGKNSFEFSILMYCENFELTRYEKFFDKYYKKLNLSYNIRESVDSNKGLSRSEEFKKNISDKNKGKPSKKKGISLSEEIKTKISKSLIGNTYSLGRHLPDNTREKMSMSRKGKLKSEETKKKMSDASKKRKRRNNGTWTSTKI
jgi:group I intron endonuclease